MHGEGTFTYSNGDVYKGEWVNGLKHGQGSYSFKESNTQVSKNCLQLIIHFSLLENGEKES